MIVQLRIDERLIHGQVAAAWSKALDNDTIVCASDEASANQLKKCLLLMAAPPGKKVRIASVDEVIRLLSDPRAKKMKIFLLTDTIKDAVKLVKALDIKEVNLGNYHDRNDNNSIDVCEGCAVNQENYNVLKELSTLVEKSYSQLLPSLEKKELKKLLQ